MVCPGGLAGLLVAGARRRDDPCQVDTDCLNAACGGEVCVHSSAFDVRPANTSGRRASTTAGVPALTGAEVNSNCKCASMARHARLFCTFTVPPGAAPAAPRDGRHGTGTGGSGTGTAAPAVGAMAAAASRARSRSRARAGLALLAAALPATLRRRV
jgi:hypothetical protein